MPTAAAFAHADGIGGPVLRMRDDELLIVLVRNALDNDEPLALAIDGLEQLADDGARSPVQPNANATLGVAKDRDRTFYFRVPAWRRVAPSVVDSLTQARDADDSFQALAPSTLAFGVRNALGSDASGALVGVVLVTRRGAERSADNLAPRDVDREFVLCVGVVDESASSLLARNAAAFASAASLDDVDFRSSNRKCDERRCL